MVKAIFVMIGIFGKSMFLNNCTVVFFWVDYNVMWKPDKCMKLVENYNEQFSTSLLLYSLLTIDPYERVTGF